MPSASRVHHLLYRLQTIKNRILLSAPQSTVNMDVKQLQYMNRQQSKLQIYIRCQLSQQVVFPTERSYTFYTAGFGASTRVNTTYYTPNISYRNGEREKNPREEIKKQKKEKNFAIQLNEAKTTALQEQTKWQLLSTRLSGDQDFL